MVKNQLFRVLPDTEIIQTLLEAFGLTSLEDAINFLPNKPYKTMKPQTN